MNSIKKLAKKAQNRWNYPNFIYPNITSEHFPEDSIAEWQISARLKGVKNELRNRNVSYNLGSLYTVPHKVSIDAYKYLLECNPNNIGNWSGSPPKDATQQLEFEVIRKTIELYNASNEKIEGYITTGGTEGNLFSVWLGKSYLKQFSPLNKICLLRTCLTHYSVTKAADISSIQDFVLPLDETSWGMHAEGLYKKIVSLNNQGFTSFLLPFTLGYTLPGTSDNIDILLTRLKKIKKEIPNINFFTWIDASLNGLIEPFLTKFSPFSDSLIQTIVTDYHKFGMVPYPSGVVLYRNSLKKLIEKPIDYLVDSDNTLLGSRTGLASASTWAIIHYLGKKGFKDIVDKQMENKQYFINQLQKNEDVKILSESTSLSCGIVFLSRKNFRLDTIVEEKYWLFAKRVTYLFFPVHKKQYTIYKFFFLPHVEKRVIKEFLDEI